MTGFGAASSREHGPRRAGSRDHENRDGMSQHPHCGGSDQRGPGRAKQTARPPCRLDVVGGINLLVVTLDRAFEVSLRPPELVLFQGSRLSQPQGVVRLQRDFRLSTR
jgi:hypothetical protein